MPRGAPAQKRNPPAALACAVAHDDSQSHSHRRRSPSSIGTSRGEGPVQQPGQSLDETRAIAGRRTHTPRRGPRLVARRMVKIAWKMLTEGRDYTAQVPRAKTLRKPISPAALITD